MVQFIRDLSTKYTKKDIHQSLVDMRKNLRTFENDRFEAHGSTSRIAPWLDSKIETRPLTEIFAQHIQKYNEMQR